MTKIIRRPDFAGGGLTDKERELMAEHVKLWTRRAFRTAPIDRDKITAAIHGIYDAAKLKRPIVVIVPSPFVMALAGGFAAAIWYLRKHHATDDAAHNAIRNATDFATRNATHNATHNATRNATDFATRIAAHNATRNATDFATHNAIRNATDFATRNAAHNATDTITARFMLGCATNYSNMYQGGNMWAGWECYLTAARDILGLRLKEHAAYAPWEQAAIEGGFRIMHKEFCVVSDFPEHILIDERNRPHCANGPSHRWRDGWSLYHWHGVRVPAEWIENKASLTASAALGQTNAELRRAACEIIGWEKILASSNAKELDSDPDPEIGSLMEMTLLGRREVFLRVRCGTGRTFAIPVPPETKTAMEAQAWTWGLDLPQFMRPEVRT